jgi:hypothetical protein
MEVIEFIHCQPWPMFDITCLPGCEPIERHWFVTREHIELTTGEIIDY